MIRESGLLFLGHPVQTQHNTTQKRQAKDGRDQQGIAIIVNPQ